MRLVLRGWPTRCRPHGETIAVYAAPDFPVVQLVGDLRCVRTTTRSGTASST